MLMMEDSVSFGDRKESKRKWIALAVCTAAVGIGVGVLIGWFSNNGSDSQPQPEQEGVCLGKDVPPKIIEDGEPEMTGYIFDYMNAENIKDNLFKWTSFPHLGGDEGELRLADELRDMWLGQGLEVSKIQYDVLLSYPNMSDLSVIELLNDTRDVTFATQKVEKVIYSADNNSDIVPPFNAYSATGDVEGPLVYVNYGRIEDFEYLEELGVDLTGTIAIARYGKIFRADKVALAAQFGAVGCILYTDPADYSVGSDPTYPDSWWLPDTGVQRGTVFRFDGDPLTPGYPSIDSAYRVPEENASIPTIPAHPISFGDATKFLEKMDGIDSPAHWKGGLNVSYKIGPGFMPQYSNWTTRMHITTYTERRNTTNVIGYIRGSVEPDRYVLLSNHRDAWVFGAVDPTSGTAVMAEVSRVLMELVNKHNWRPRRTIIFASWGAEEYGLTGSYEWVEHFIKTLKGRTVACLNVDLALQGNESMRGLGVPLLYNAMYDVAKKIETPNVPGKTMYEEWFQYQPGKDVDNVDTGYPSIGSLGSGSDYAAFIVLAGIPAVDVRYDYNSTRWPISGYPLYHSAYETFFLVEEYLDPEFKYSAAVGKYWAEIARYLADSLKLPLNATTYGDALRQYVKGLDYGYGEKMANNSIKLDDLYAAIELFREETIEFHKRMDTVDTTNPLFVRQFNDQLMLLERAFTDPEGLPTRPLYKHVLFAPSQHDGYAGATFPGLVDLMYDIDENPENWEKVRKHLAAIIFAIHSAAATLRDPLAFSQ